MSQIEIGSRFINKNQKDITYFEKLVLWFKMKIQYKAFRLEIFQTLNKSKKNEFSKCDMPFIRELFPFFLINAFIYKIYIERKQKYSKIILSTIATLSYTYLVFIFYGEEKLFYREAIKDNILGYHIRRRYLEELNNNKYVEYFNRLNQGIIEDCNDLKVSG